MQWYWIAAFVAAFIALVVLTVYLTKSGKISKQVLDSVCGVTAGMSAITTAIAQSNDNVVLNIAGMVATFVNKAVLAAENAWYNNDISKDERRGYCLNKLGELLEAYQIELSEDQWKVVDTLIAASCEEMGHTAEATEETEIVPERV